MQIKLTIRIAVAAFAGALLSGGYSAAEVLPLNPVKDTTIFSESDSESDGAGSTFFAGRIGSNGGGALRRALIAFDVSSMPSNAVIESVSLALWRTQRNPGGASPTTSMSLHLLTQDWGEAGSSASTGAGAPAQTGDATWRYTFFSTAEWGNSGGTYVSTASATTLVGAPEAVYIWSSPGMVADVQSWVNGSSGNFGWILLGDEQSNFSVREFVSRDIGDISKDLRPGLSITYTVPVPEPGTVGMLLAGLAILLAIARKRLV